MMVSGRDEPRAPFPRPRGIAGTLPSASGLWLRPFGIHESDLAVDFGATLRPLAVTHVLACCTHGGEAAASHDELLWSLPVGVRIQALLTLATAWDGAEIPLGLRCPESGCEEELELEVTLDEVAAMQEEAYAVAAATVDLGETTLVIRRPTGIDQLDWLRARYADESEAIATMVRTLAAGGNEAKLPLTVDAVAAIEEAMDELDPLVNFVATVRCFNCGREHAHAIDLEELALRRLRRAQHGLLSTVHRLAKRYHWNEREIFAVPHWRRSYYLALIEREEER